MSAQITELTFLQHLASRFNISVPEYLTAVTVASQNYCGNLVGGWALGKGGQTIDVPGRKPIPVFSDAADLFHKLPEEKRPNKIVVLYIEPGGLYEKEAVEMLKQTKFPKPIIAYITGEILEKFNLSLGHAGAVVEFLDHQDFGKPMDMRIPVSECLTLTRPTD